MSQQARHPNSRTFGGTLHQMLSQTIFRTRRTRSMDLNIRSKVVHIFNPKDPIAIQTPTQLILLPTMINRNTQDFLCLKWKEHITNQLLLLNLTVWVNKSIESSVKGPRTPRRDNPTNHSKTKPRILLHPNTPPVAHLPSNPMLQHPPRLSDATPTVARVRPKFYLQTSQLGK